MKPVVKVILSFFVVLLAHLSYAQDADGLKKQILETKSDTQKLRLIIDLVETCEGKDILDYSIQALSISNKLLNDSTYSQNENINLYKARALNNIGYYYLNADDFEQSKKYYLASLEVTSQLNQNHYQVLKHRLVSYVGISDLCDVDSVFYYANQAKQMAEVLLNKFPNKKDINESRENYAVAFNNIGFYYDNIGEPDSALICYNKAVNIYKELNNEEYLALAYSNMSEIHVALGALDSGLFYLEKAEYFSLKNKAYETLIAVYSHYISIFYSLGNHVKSIEYLNKTIEIQNAVNPSPEIIAHSYNSLAIIYMKDEEYDKAEEYMNKIFEMEADLTQGSLTSYYFNMANLNEIMGDDKAMVENLNTSLKIAKEQDLKYDQAYVYVKMANIYKLKNNEITTSEIYLDSALRIYKGIPSYKGISDVAYEKALILIQNDELIEGQKYAEMSYQYAQKVGFYSQITLSTQLLAKIYDKNKQYKQAYQMLDLYVTLKDSLESEDKKNEFYKSKIDLEYNQKVYADSLKASQEKEMTELKLNKKNAQIEKQQARNTLLIFGLLFLVVLIAIMIRAYSKKRELVSTIRSQKELVEDKNKEITDSINYASKIQRAILTSDDYFDKVLNDYLVLYEPKDIVSGDFYWLYQIDENQSIIAVVDCTGHGVPGAFMSMIGNSLLNEIVIENKTRETNVILDRLREGVIKSLSQSGEDNSQKDGMDMAVCLIDNKSRHIQYSGANNSLWIVSGTNYSQNLPESKCDVITDGQLYLVDIKADKFPIGKHTGVLKPFEAIDCQLSPGDTIYMSTDGYADQFGGKKNKKYKYKRFKNFLISINHLPMEERKKAIKQEFVEWKGDEEQLDDVCVVGIRL